MLDLAFLRDNLDAVRRNCRDRGSSVDIDAIARLDEERRRLQKLGDAARAQANDTAKKVGGTKDKAEKDALIAEGKRLRDEVARLEAEAKGVEEQLRPLLAAVPNLTHPDAPAGAGDDANVVLREVGEKPAFAFPVRDHVELCDALDLADLEAGTRVAGQKFYFLKNEGALLELALVQYAVCSLVARGFTPVITPDVARIDVMEGTGYMPRNPDPTKQEFYRIADSDLCLIATAEITIGGMHRDHIFEEVDLPRLYVGLSHCFRTEAGAAGRDTRGLYRVHQFTKVEMFAFCAPDQSEGVHRSILEAEEAIFAGLGVPYRVIDTCIGDLGGPAYRKYDLEAWMPGRGDKKQGEYGEVTSTSNCTDYQARRLNIRYRPAGQKGTKFVHTLNGTAVACTRAIVAVLENGQRADGSVAIPEVLRPWVGKETIAPRGPK